MSRGTLEPLDIILSGMVRLATEAIVGILTSQADQRQVLRPLAFLLEDLPARECWCNALVRGLSDYRSTGPYAY